MDVNLLQEGKWEGCVQKGKIHHLETVCECVGFSANVGTAGCGTHWVCLRGLLGFSSTAWGSRWETTDWLTPQSILANVFGGDGCFSTLDTSTFDESVMVYRSLYIKHYDNMLKNRETWLKTATHFRTETQFLSDGNRI